MFTEKFQRHSNRLVVEIRLKRLNMSHDENCKTIILKNTKTVFIETTLSVECGSNENP